MNKSMGSGSPSELVQKSSVWSKIVGFPQFGILIVFIGLFAVLGIMAPESFLSGGNLINVMRQASAQMVVAIGMTFVLILGGIDLSVGSVANLCGTISAGLIVKNGMSLEAAVAIGMAIGLGLGVVNGIVISKLKLQPFIATLAMMSIAKGASLLYSGGMPISQLGDAYIELGRGYVGILPIPVIIMIAVIAVAWIILGRTVFGRRVYMTGGNEEAARLSGIKVDRIKIIVYAICGFTAALTGIIYTARLGSSQPTMADGLELDAIAAVVLGGTSLLGGRGFILGTIVGGMFLSVLSNGLNILNVSSFWQQVMKGIILVVAVVLYTKTAKTK